MNVWLKFMQDLNSFISFYAIFFLDESCLTAYYSYVIQLLVNSYMYRINFWLWFSFIHPLKELLFKESTKSTPSIIFVILRFHDLVPPNWRGVTVTEY